MSMRDVKHLVLFCVGFFSMAEALSFLDKENQHFFGVNAIANGRKHNGHELTGKTCANTLSDSQCESFEAYCSTSEYLKDGCRKTCRICQSSPPNCKTSPLGCCWDNVTKIERGKPCPTCSDINNDCKIMKVNCMDDLTRRLCPLTCGVTCETCADNPDQAEHCALFKRYGICSSDADLMKKYCKKTCGLC
eukprot:gene13948-15404_t